MLDVSVDHSSQLHAISYTLHITSSIPVPFDPFSTKLPVKFAFTLALNPSISFAVVFPYVELANSWQAISITFSPWSIGTPDSSNVYLLNFIVLSPLLVWIVPTGIHTNSLPAVAPWFLSTITIPSSTLSSGFWTVKPGGTTT